MHHAKDTPLAEITLRKYEKPANIDGRDLVKKICLSLGLLQPGDSRDVIVDVLYVILKEKKAVTASDVEKKVIESRKKHNIPLHGIAGSNIRRQLKRLKDLLLIETIQNKYRMTENLTLLEIVEDKIEKYYLKSILERVKEYCRAVQ
ncbi:hypothetical protein J4464_04320 [Candidatus Woesearchaeota archaeon]|nr:hypothetical protein [Candidatus Woesearchaeota archaeon]